MIVKFVSRFGTAGTRCAKRIAQSAIANPNAQLGWEKACSRQTIICRSFTAISSPCTFNSFPVANMTMLSVTDPMASARRTLQTKGDKDLVDFLSEEISAEKKSHDKLPNISPFQASSSDAEVTFTKKTNAETIIIKFNVNNSLDSDSPVDTEDNMSENVKLTSRPNFTVEIERGSKILSLACSFAEESQGDDQLQPQQDDAGDLFTINEISVYEGDFSETTYSTAGDILDGNLYDLLMDMLEDRGVTNDFVQKLSEYSTVYEHERYVGLLENLKKFFN